MTLGERLYRAAVATGAHPWAFPYAEAAKLWTDLDEAQQARWEACAVMVDAATRADVTGQLHALANDWCDGNVHHAAEVVEAGRAVMSAPYRLKPLHPPGETMQERLARLAPVEARTLVAIGYLEQRIADRRDLGFRTVTEEADLFVARGTLDRVRAWMAAARMAIVLEELSLDRANVDAQLSVLPASWRLSVLPAVSATGFVASWACGTKGRGPRNGG